MSKLEKLIDEFKKYEFLTEGEVESLCAKAKEILVDPPIAPSRYLQEFEEIRLIANGGYGYVYECRHNIEQKTYAIKKIASNESKIHTDFREVTAHSLLQHPRVVQYYRAWVEVGSFDDYEPDSDDERVMDRILFIQMELCGRSLGNVLDLEAVRSVLFEREEQKVACANQLLEGLSYIHSKNIIHGDLTRDNIFFDNNECALKIGDFGSARVALEGWAALTEEEWGNHVYWPPPKEVDESKVTFKTDVFSLGLVLYDIWKQFTTHAHRHRNFSAIRNGDLQILQSVQKCQFLSSLLAENPADRPLVEDALNNFNAHLNP